MSNPVSKTLSQMSEDVVKTILSETSDPVTGNTPVAYTIIYNEIDILGKIVKLGGSLTKPNKENYSPFHFGKISPMNNPNSEHSSAACMYSSYPTVLHLISQHCPEQGVGGVQKQTCLHLASSRQDTEAARIVKLLLSNGDPASVLSRDSSGNIPLFCAIEAGNIDVVRELLSVDPHAQVTLWFLFQCLSLTGFPLSAYSP